ncbi:MAG: hypothetical protein WCJ59_00505 [bacterium]
MKKLYLLAIAFAVAMTCAFWHTNHEKTEVETVVSQETKVPAKQSAEANVASGKHFKDSGFSFVGP